MAVATHSPLSPELQEAIRTRLAQSPSQMTMQLASEFSVPEVEIIRLMPEDRVAELDIERWEALFGEFPAFGKVHVIVSNGAATLETEGVFGGFSTWGEFFNVQSKTLDMHIRYRNLTAVFAIEKPSHMTGVNTLSLQFYDHTGQCAMKIFPAFGNRSADPEIQQHFDSIRSRYRRIGG